ncbi:MAG: hypothetical protein R6V44_12795 [Paracoccaceae bacterium]
MRRLTALVAAAALCAPTAASAAPSTATPAAPRAVPAFEAVVHDLLPGLSGAAAESGFEDDALRVAAKKGGANRGGNRGGARIRKGGNTRYSKGGTFRNNTVVVNRGRPYRGGGRYYYDDDDNGGAGVAGALVGGIIGLGVGAAIANSSSPDNTCVDNNGDGYCDAY